MFLPFSESKTRRVNFRESPCNPRHGDLGLNKNHGCEGHGFNFLGSRTLGSVHLAPAEQALLGMVSTCSVAVVTASL